MEVDDQVDLFPLYHLGDGEGDLFRKIAVFLPRKRPIQVPRLIAGKRLPEGW